jgi:hypothetical protein
LRSEESSSELELESLESELLSTVSRRLAEAETLPEVDLETEEEDAEAGVEAADCFFLF